MWLAWFCGAAIVAVACWLCFRKRRVDRRAADMAQLGDQ